MAFISGSALAVAAGSVPALESLPTVVVIALAIAALATAVVGLTTVLWFGFQLFTVPGVVVHEFAHATACRLVGVRVLEAVYFRFGDPAGYVRHEQPRRYREAFVVSVAPFLVNTVVSLLAFAGLAGLVATGDVSAIGDGSAIDALETVSRETLAAAVALGWIGLSVGMCAFPSTGDANVLWTRSRAEWRRSPAVLLGLPAVAVIYAANVLSWLWADVLYAAGLLVVAFALVGVPLS